MNSLLCLLLISLSASAVVPSTIPLGARSFKIDYDNNCFLKDGKPFRFVSSSLHYFRVPDFYWEDRMQRLKALGVNTIQTYIEWSQHEPEPGQYNFGGNLDVVKFMKTAQKLNLLVILRPGPYIDAERDFGGLPYWLLRNKNLKVRSSDPSFMVPVAKWMGVLLPKFQPLMYENGGPIISAQVENEYGSYFTRDRNYTEALRDILSLHLGKNTLLFSTDGDSVGYLKYGTLPGVYATVDYGSGTNVTAAFAAQRVYSPRGPLVNSEYYPGWLDHWGQPHANVSGSAVSETLDQILSMNASVNIYMGHGGTSFGFTAGANGGGNSYQACPTSYDYDAPITEAGDITPKFLMMREVILKHTGQPKSPTPTAVPKMALGPLPMKRAGSVLSALKTVESVFSESPMSFEDLGQAYGYVLYSTVVTSQHFDPTVLKVAGIKDRGYVFVDNEYRGMVSRAEQILQLPLTAEPGQTLSILVENQGRICFGSGLQDSKGLVPPVHLGTNELSNWTMVKMPPLGSGWLDKVLENLTDNEVCGVRFTSKVPAFYVSTFQLPKDKPDYPHDSFLRMDGWFKGVAILNGFNLGRYWPVVGPQVTLYVPKILFRPYPAVNRLVMAEFEKAPCETDQSCAVSFVTVPEVNGPTPH